MYKNVLESGTQNAEHLTIKCKTVVLKTAAIHNLWTCHQRQRVFDILVLKELMVNYFIIMLSTFWIRSLDFDIFHIYINFYKLFVILFDCGLWVSCMYYRFVVG